MASALATASLLWPAFQPLPSDSLPASNYPMFARPRGRVTSLPFVLLRENDQVERRLTAREIGATSEPMQAAMSIRQAIDSDAPGELCDEIAAGLPDIGTVEVVTGVFDAVAWFEGDTTPIERTVHASCRSEHEADR